MPSPVKAIMAQPRQEQQQQQLHLNISSVSEGGEEVEAKPSDRRQSTNYRWWMRVALYAFFVICGQSVATLLGRLYYDKGGKSTWMATLVQVAGFPILLPYYFIFIKAKPNSHCNSLSNRSPSLVMLSSVYVTIGLIMAADCMLYSIGLLYLPVSTYSLICATQLAFNALFSFFLNAQKFTPFIVNSLVLLTISSALLVFQSSDSSSSENGVSKGKYVLGFVCTVGASAGYGLGLSLTQLAFRRVIKRETFRVVMDMLIYQSIVATMAIVVGLFASGEWKGLGREMGKYRLGKVSYVMNLVWTAVAWQIFGIGAVGLIFEASALFSNAVSAVGLPVVPVLAAIFFKDKMDGIQVMSMILAVWGFISYVYQHYDNHSKQTTDRYAN